MTESAHLIRNLDLEGHVADALRAEAPLVRVLRAAGEEQVAAALEESFAYGASAEPRVLLLLLHEGASALELAVGSRPFLRHHGRLIPLLEGPISRPSLLDFSDRLPFPEGTGALAGCTLRLSGETDRLRVTLCGPPPDLEGIDPHGELREQLALVESGLIVVSGPAATEPEISAASVVAYLAAQRDLRIAVVDPPSRVIQMGNRSLFSSHTAGEAQSWGDLFDRVLGEADVVAAGRFRPERLADYLQAALSGTIVVLSAYESSFESLLGDLGWAQGPASQRLQAFLLADALSLLVVQRAGERPGQIQCEAISSSDELRSALRDLQPPPIKRLLRDEAQRARARARAVRVQEMVAEETARTTGKHRIASGETARTTGKHRSAPGEQGGA